MTGERPRRVPRLPDPDVAAAISASLGQWRVPHMPGHLQHDDPDVAAVLNAAHQYNADDSRFPWDTVARAIGALPITHATQGIVNVATELDLAGMVDDCSSRDEFEDLTGVLSRSASWRDDAEHHADVIRNDARMAAEQLVARARAAAKETER